MVLLQNSRTTIIFKRSYSILMTLKLKKLCIEIWMTLLSNIFSIRKRIDNGNPDFFILSDQTYTHFPLECLLKPRQSGASNQKALFLIQNGMSIFFFCPFCLSLLSLSEISSVFMVWPAINLKVFENFPYVA